MFFPNLRSKMTKNTILALFAKSKKIDFFENFKFFCENQLIILSFQHFSM
jgi:hypothetical protein